MKSTFIFFVFIYCVTLLDGLRFRCDYVPGEHGWFKPHKIPATWADARLMCQCEGAVLASPTSPKLRAELQNFTAKDNHIYTGIHATFAAGHYYTINGVPLSDIPHEWSDGDPDNRGNDERCLIMTFKGQLADVNCKTTRRYVCYREYSEGGVNSICGTTDPEYYFETRTNKCYKFHTKPKSFERAFFTCSAEGGHLAIINSEVESKVISDLYKRYLNKMVGVFRKDVAFIGFHNWGEGGDWRTIHGQTIEEAGFSTFVKGNPNNRTTGEYCGSVLPDGLLNDLWCQENYAFICEKHPDIPALCDISEDEYDDKAGVKPIF